ncbi:MAG: T9SS type A sorting domain-containing protein [Saprospiraceae bacterium]|nr:T9SS type A sorting domain-containing protein [Saprospiraceae bacterium]
MMRLLVFAVLLYAAPLSMQAFDRTADSLELVKLYNSTEGNAWFDSWELSQPMSTWNGVTLNDSGQVVVLNLGNNNLVGSLPNLNLPEISILRLASNTLREGLPSFIQMPKLIDLDLQNNQLDGPLRDFQLPNLNNLNLSRNRLSAEIPNFSNMPGLVTLNLRVNRLSGMIPDFSGMTGLINLLLSDNQLEGILPDFNHIDDLISLDVHNNRLGFNVPELGNLTELFVLDISENNFAGFLPDFRRASRLDRLRVNDNNFAGPLPNFGRLTLLRDLDVSNNNFGGTLPPMGSLEDLEVFNASGNLIEGEIPTFEGLVDLEVLDLSDNLFSDTLPDLSGLESLEELYVDSNLLVHSFLDAGQMDNLQVLDAKFNYFTFQDLEAINGLSLTGFTYAPQRRIVMPDTIFATINDDVTFDLVEDENFNNNTYQWYHNEEFLDARAVNEFTLNNINALDEGVYYAIVKNDIWPALSLFSEEIQLVMDCPINEVIIVDSICAGDTLFVNDSAYFETGFYTDSVVVNDPATCDSVFVVTLTILPVYDTTLLDTICESDQVMFGGQIITESGSYTDTLQSQDGCDSVVHLNLIVRPAFEAIRVDSICAGDTLFIGHFAHTITGIYKDTLQTIYGCDSVIFTDLTVLDTSLSVTNVSLCLGESYDFRGTTYTESGTYIDATTNNIGCDSTFILHLAVPTTDQYFFTREICTGDSIVFGDTVITQSGVYTDSLQTAIGCDSIVFLTVDVVDSYELTFDVVLCGADTLFFGGDTITSTGIYIDSLLARGGCDSIVKARVTTVTLAAAPSIDTVLCFGDSLVVGDNVYKQADVYRDTFPGDGSCDTVIVSRVNIAEPLILQGVQLRLNPDNVGSIVPDIGGGLGALSYIWSTGSTEPSLDSIGQGTYLLSVTDEAGCTVDYDFVLDPTTRGNELDELKAEINLYPNPAYGTQMYVDINGLPGTYQFEVFDLFGRVVLKKEWVSRTGAGVLELDIASLSGMYHLVLSDVSGRSLSRRFVVH